MSDQIELAERCPYCLRLVPLCDCTTCLEDEILRLRQQVAELREACGLALKIRQMSYDEEQAEQSGHWRRSRMLHDEISGLEQKLRAALAASEPVNEAK